MFVTKKSAVVLTAAGALLTFLAYAASHLSITSIDSVKVDGIPNPRLSSSEPQVGRTTAKSAPIRSLQLSSGSSVTSSPSGGIIEVVTDEDRGWFDIQMTGLPASTDARYANMGFAPVSRSVQTVAGMSTSPSLTTRTTVFDTTAGGTSNIRIYAILKGQSSANLNVVIRDQAGNSICQSSGSSANNIICDVTVSVANPTSATTHSYTATAENSGSAQDTLDLRLFSFLTTEGFGTAGPSTFAAGDIVKVRHTFNHRIYSPQVQSANFLRVYTSSTQMVREYLVLTSWNGQSAQAMHILTQPFDAFTSAASNNQYGTIFAHRAVTNRAFIDVPVNATSVRFSAHRSNLGSPNTTIPTSAPLDVDLYLFAPTGPDSVENMVPAQLDLAMANYKAETVNSSSSSNESITVSGASLTPGRWMIVAKSKTGEPMNMRVAAKFESFGAPPNFRFGNYYNPSRNGHGIYFDKGSNQWIILWYTYLEDGTPIWYQAQAAAPSAEMGFTKWEAPLYRYTWNGSGVVQYQVGFVHVALLGDTSLKFSYVVNGVAGSETMVPVTSGGCAQVSGANFDIMGQWYSPSKSGFGYSVEHSTANNTEVWETYLYDASGTARWLYGQKSFTPTTSTINMLQFRGTCPSCSFFEPTNRVAGTVTRNIVSQALPDNLPGYGSVNIGANLLTPLSGSWSESLPVGFLSDRKSCR